ncbi:TetR/AcrR family transcriptional regulator [Secundilactobacillus muriivasis]
MATQHTVETLFEDSIQSAELSDKQKAVLRASLTLFSQKGFDHTTTSDIATLAQVSEGTVFKQFRTKQALLNALLVPFLEHVIPKIASEFIDSAQHVQIPNFSDFLAYVLHDRMQFISDNQHYLRIFVQELILHPANIQALMINNQALIQQGIATMELVLKQYQLTNQLVDWPAPRIGRYVIGVFVSHAGPQLVLNTEPQNVDRACDEALEFLLRGLQP